ncbi:hypothetical protein N9955_00365 [bacterium]|nr:hypothetical protein [bacterium]
MSEENVFEEIIGQRSVKDTLKLYLDSYKVTERLPFLNFVAQRGAGKSFVVRKFREGLRRKDGSRPPIYEVNSATIKDTAHFFDKVYPTWVEHSAFLFLDEIHALPRQIQEVLLSPLEVKKDPVRYLEYDNAQYKFDFNKISFCGATTDAQKLLVPFKDRLRSINLEAYESNELFEVLLLNLDKNVSISECAKEDICSTFRGHPRDVVERAEDINIFAAARNCYKITKEVWKDFCSAMGVKPFGLNYSEIQVLKAVAQKGVASLTDISSITGLGRSLIQKDLEGVLVRKNLLTIDGKRKLTADGIRFCKEQFTN